MNQDRIALIDGDILLHQAAFAAEKEVDFGDWVYLAGDFKFAPNELRQLTDHVGRCVGANRIVVCLTDNDHNFRKDVYPAYKGNRVKLGSRKPLVLAKLRTWYEDNYETVCKPGLEADDVMGILATGNFSGFGGHKIVCSIDKDLKTIPGEVFSWYPGQKEKGIQTITDEQADYNFYLQALMGDTTDGYPGCPGFGPKKADKWLRLEEREDMWAAVVAAYGTQGLTEEDALTQARCARILRASDYDAATGEVILWQP